MKYLYTDFIKEYDRLKSDNKPFWHNTLYIDKHKIDQFTYMIQYSEMFDSDISKEMRGIIFLDEEKYFLALPKFFNMNENKCCFYKDLINKKLIEVSEKIDGSIIIPVIIENKIYMKSNSSFISDHAKLANKIINSNDNYKKFIFDLYDKNLFPVFELTSPDYKIVLNYDEKLSLLQIRDAEGNFLDIEKFNSPFDKRKKYNNTLDELIEICKDKKDFEGYVLRFEGNLLVKLKTSWYVYNHKILTEIK